MKKEGTNERTTERRKEGKEGMKKKGTNKRTTERRKEGK